MEGKSPLDQLVSKMKAYTKEEIEAKKAQKGDFDWYYLEDGSFFDTQGYYYDVEGFDDIGGYYDSISGLYVPPPLDLITGEAEDADEYYDELCGSDEENEGNEDEGDEEEDDYQIGEKEANSGIRREHCLPALNWLKDQPKDKNHIIKICNIPRMASEVMVEKFFKRQFKGLTYSKFGIEHDVKEKANKGVGYMQSDDHHTLSCMIKLHYFVYAGYRLRTYLMGFAYDDV